MFDMREAIAGSVDPDVLDTMDPGPFLGILLAGVEPNTGLDHIRLLQQHARQVAYHQAHMYRQMIAIAETVAADEPDITAVSEGTVGELRVALQLTRRAAEGELVTADALVNAHPDVLAALETGRIDRRRAAAIIYAVGHLDPPQAHAVVEQVLDDAADLTTGQIAARIRRLSAELDPDDANNRYERAVGQRRVEAVPSPDGTVHLHARDLPPDRVARIRDRINRIARGLRGRGEIRTMDQLRADVFLDLLEGTAGTGSTGADGDGVVSPRDRAGVIDLRVDLTTLADLDDKSGDLGGYGPVIADIARRIADDTPNAQWRFTVTDPDRRTHRGRAHPEATIPSPTAPHPSA